MTGGGIPRRGSLSRHSVTSLLQMLQEERESGCLSVSRGRVTRRLFVKDGMMIFATSSERQDRLGEILIAQGSLTRSEVNEAFRRAKHSQARLGHILLVEGKINSQELFQGVTAQMVTILERMRSWRKGDFEFHEGAEPEPGSVLLRIPLSLYLRGREKTRKEPAEETAAVEAAAPPPEEEEEVIVIEEEQEALPTPEEGAEQPAPAEVPAEEEDLAPAGEAKEVGDLYDEVVIPEDEPSEVEKEKFIQELTFQLQELRQRSGADAHTLLGVKPAATPDKIQEAFHYLARLLHPDQHPEGTPAEVAEEAAELFRQVTAAYEQLTTPSKSFYLPAPGRISASEDPLDEGDVTREYFFKARKYMAKGNYWQAADALRNVVRRKPRDAMSRNLLGFCLMQTGRRLHEAEEHIKEAIRLDPGNPDYVTSLGLIYKAGRFHSKARDMFQQALLYDKNHQQARQELKKLAGEVETTKKTKVFWSRIFGR